MKRLFFLFFFFCGALHAQGVRFESQVMQQGSIANVRNAVLIPSAPIISFCNAPANAVPCTNKAITYRDSALAAGLGACPTATQIVLAGTTACVASPDVQNNWGVWVPPGQYAFTVTVNGINQGPFYVTTGTGGSGSFTLTNNPGVFTNAQQNEYLKSIVNSCNSVTEYQAAQGVNSYTSAISGCLSAGSTSSVQGAFALIGLATNSSATTNVAGMYSQARCLATGAHCWGANPLVADAAGQVGMLTGTEIDVVTNNTAYGGTPPTALNIAANFAAGQPSGGTAAFIGKPLTAGLWPTGWACNEAAATVCFSMGAAASSANSNSQILNASTRDAGAVVRNSSLFVDNTGAWTLNSFIGKLILDNNTVQRGLVDYSGNTALRTYTTPDASGSVSLAAVEYCGATSGATQACAKTVQTLPLVVWGDVTLNTATTQSITTLPFTDALYTCTGSDLTTAAGIVSFNTYAAASVTIQESGGVNTDHLRYVCVGH